MKRKTDSVRTVLVRLEGNSVALSADGAGEARLPARLLILRWGDNPNANGRAVRVGPKLARMMASPVYPFGTIPLDYEHSTVAGTPAYQESREPRPVAGFGRVELVPGEGVFLAIDRWTPGGAAAAENYRDVSAAAVTDGDGDVVMIPSAALCRCGAVPGMEFREAQVTTAVLSALAQINTEDDDVNWKQMVCKALGLDPEATGDEDAAKALEAALAAMRPEALSAAISQQVGVALTPLSAQVEGLKTAFAAELEKRDRQALLDGALRDGKVVALSAEAVGQLSLTALADHIGKLPVTVPLSARTPGVVPPDGGSVAGVTEHRRAMAERCGVDADKVFGGAK